MRFSDIIEKLDVFKLPAELYFNKKRQKKHQHVNKSIQYRGTLFGFLFTVFGITFIFSYACWKIVNGIINQNDTTYSKIDSPNLFDAPEDSSFDLSVNSFNTSKDSQNEK